ncbi:sugar ABC transporter ATP-binding protein [Williamsia sp. 1138]|uniref:sugar ABC transporter ATP-binding protein n=1 Tax=Williamsia sp. 1138 TaxID=1903117 RepID=UPI000B9AA011|nr:sugar ABC transporter ATP-binding protein [Williamsia sp. 1138]OZG26311.1 sugar ABC transporter ATP-binding protein [Williamsia sp. 1138]
MTFGNVKVLHDVDLSIGQGEIHGLVGENGSGKSTLVKILGGIHTPDSGSEVRLHGNAMNLPVRDPQQHGLAIVHQDLALVESMSVADNTGISTGYERPLTAPISSRREAEVVGKLCEQFGFALDPHRLVGTLSPAERTVVAILRALRQLGDGDQRKVIILDEPTAALPRGESLRLLELLRTMAGNGTAVLYISHHMNEVLSVCDRISVLRNGKIVATRESSSASEAEIVELMLGYEIGEFYPDKPESSDKVVRLDVNRMTHGPVSELSFQARQGEIVGITGLTGMGQDDVPYLLAGGRTRLSGEVTVDGVATDGEPRSAKQLGMQLVPGNRQRDALWLGGSASENLTLPFLKDFWRRWRLRRATEHGFSDSALHDFGVRPLRPSLEITKFSGGNQQKVVMARALRQRPGVLLLHEPTQGVDVGAKKEILNVVRQAATDGAAVVVFSSDAEEVAQLCNRVHVMRYGSISATLTGSEVSEDRILTLSQQSSVVE